MEKGLQKPKVFVFMNGGVPHVVSDIDLELYVVDGTDHDPTSEIVHYDYSEAIVTEPEVEVDEIEVADYHRKLVRQPIRFRDMQWEALIEELEIDENIRVSDLKTLRKASGRIFMAEKEPDEIVYRVENLKGRAEGLVFANVIAQWSEGESDLLYVAYEEKDENQQEEKEVTGLMLSEDFILKLAYLAGDERAYYSERGGLRPTPHTWLPDYTVAGDFASDHGLTLFEDENGELFYVFLDKEEEIAFKKEFARELGLAASLSVDEMLVRKVS